MKTALITGAAGGIGEALCVAFQDAGYRVIATDRVVPSVGTTKLLIDLGRLVADPSYRQEALAGVRAELAGELNVLVNNAAIQVLGSVEQLTVEGFRLSQDINVVAPFVLTQGLLSELTHARGSVINIGSIHARLTKPGFAAYATSKAALQGLTQALAVELGTKVRINAILPAAIATPMLLAGFAESPDSLAALKGFHPSGCIGQPEDIASLALFLASDQGGFLNGALLNIDGGIGARLHDPL